MDSSDDSFAWTNTSDDESDSLENKDYKKNLQRKLFHDQEASEPSDSDRKKSKKNKERKEESMIKLEPESDLERTSKKKKKKSSHDEHDYKDDSFGTTDVIDNSFLDLKVKEEQASVKSSKHLKRKLTETYDSNDTSQIDSDSKTPKKKKKKKSSKNKDEDDSYMENTVIEEKFCAEETIVQQPPEKKKKVLNKSKVDYSGMNVTSKEFIDSSSDSDSNVHHNETTDSAPRNAKINGIQETPQKRLRYESISKIPKQNVQNSSESETPKKSKKNNDSFSLTPQKSVKNNSISLTPKKTSRISDRIQFEDDNSQNNGLSPINYEPEETIVTSKLKKFMKANDKLNFVNNPLPRDSIIDDDDDIWLLKCPSEFTLTDGEGCNITLDRKCKLKTVSTTFHGHFTDSINNVAILTSKNGNIRLSNKRLQGCVTFHKRIPKAHYVKDGHMANNQTNFIPLPVTKSRHPLFGADYKERIRIPESVKTRLNDNENYTPKIKKEKKKNKKECIDSSEMEEIVPKAEISVKLEKKHKKKKKRKHSEVDEVDAAPTPSKKKKRRMDSAQVWDSAQAIEENLFNF